MPRFPDWLSKYVGIPYKTHGREMDGCDCWGLMTLIWQRELGMPLPEYRGADWFKGQDPGVTGADAAAYASLFKPIQPGEETLGDGVLLRMRGHPLHVGFVIADGWMIHTHETADSCIESYRTPTWEKRILGFYRYEP